MMTLPPHYLEETVRAEREREAARFRLARIAAAAARECRDTSLTLFGRLVRWARGPEPTCSAGC